MRINTYFNVTKEEIKQKKFNVVIGISIGNKYFTKNNVCEYILWAIKNTKEKVAIIIPDKIHALNYEIRSGYKKERAQRKAIREGEKIEKMVDEILSEIPKEYHAVCKILKWEDIETDEHKRMVSVLYDAFANNPKFKHEILEIVKEYIESSKLTNSDYEKLASYILEELPMLIGGIEHGGVVYNLLIYPGLSKIDHLKIGLQEGSLYPEISKKLNLKTEMRFIMT
jgi:tRNA-dependent cyclodipeptide synthase